MKIRPLGNRAILDLMSDKVPTLPSGIVLPNSVKGTLNHGRVLAVGTRGNEVASELEIGDETIFEENTGTPIEVGNKEYLIIDQQNILAVVGTEES